MKINPGTYYNEDYFSSKKTYTDEFGIERVYHGPAKHWHGFGIIANWIKENMPWVKTVLDVGCSAGSFVAQAVEAGLDCVGVDISEYAVSHPVPGAKGRLKVMDLKNMNNPAEHDLVVAFDLLEHIYRKDLQVCMENIAKAVKPGGSFFACIATARFPHEEWEHPSEDHPVPQDKNWLAVSGHVNVKSFKWWLDELKGFGFTRNDKLMLDFQIWRMLHPDFNKLESWSLLNVYIGEKHA